MDKTKPQSIILIGYRATGKSSLGRLLSRELNLPLVDTDALVEERYGKTIQSMFADEGESVFRDREAALVAELAGANEPMILSTGGGVPLREESRKYLKNMGFVVWLRASRETIFARMNGDDSNESRRPPLTDLKPLQEIDAVLAVRNSLYQETAHLTLKTDQCSLDELAHEIIRNLPQ
ncbi:MAG: shikimate kinase [Planctomycetia bacterium]|nr:shikimate kinase [Planctomycetia bacterium]